MKSEYSNLKHLMNLTLTTINDKHNSTVNKIDSLSKEFLFKIKNNNIYNNKSANKVKYHFVFNPVLPHKVKNNNSKQSLSSNLFDKIAKVYNDTIVNGETNNKNNKSQLKDFFLSANILKTKHLPRSSSACMLNTSKTSTTTISNNNNVTNNRKGYSRCSSSRSPVKTKMESLHNTLTNNSISSPYVSNSYKTKVHKHGRNNSDYISNTSIHPNNSSGNYMKSTYNNNDIATTTFGNTISRTKSVGNMSFENSINNMNNSVSLRNNLGNFKVDLERFLNNNVCNNNNNRSDSSQCTLLSKPRIKKLYGTNFRNNSTRYDNPKIKTYITNYNCKGRPKKILTNIKPNIKEKNKYTQLSSFLSKDNDANWYENSFNKKRNINTSLTNNNNTSNLNETSLRYTSQLKLHCM